MAGGLISKAADTWNALVGGVNAVAERDEWQAAWEDEAAENALLKAQLAEARWQRDLAEKSLAAARDEVLQLRAQLDAERLLRDTKREVVP